jgi:pyrroloquinoline quinone biosynthesis protein E
MLPGLDLPSVRNAGLQEIWYESAAFDRFRGSAWMSDTCRSCDDHEHDHGGCRCQAFLLTGSADATDPVCPKSPQRKHVDHIVDRARPIAEQPLRFMHDAARRAGLVHRTDANSRAWGDR